VQKRKTQQINKEKSEKHAVRKIHKSKTHFAVSTKRSSKFFFKFAFAVSLVQPVYELTT